MYNMRNDQTIIKIKTIINIGIWAAFFCFLILQYSKVFCIMMIMDICP